MMNCNLLQICRYFYNKNSVRQNDNILRKEILNEWIFSFSKKLQQQQQKIITNTKRRCRTKHKKNFSYWFFNGVRIWNNINANAQSQKYQLLAGRFRTKTKKSNKNSVRSYIFCSDTLKYQNPSSHHCQLVCFLCGVLGGPFSSGQLRPKLVWSATCCMPLVKLNALILLPAEFIALQSCHLDLVIFCHGVVFFFLLLVFWLLGDAFLAMSNKYI